MYALEREDLVHHFVFRWRWETDLDHRQPLFGLTERTNLFFDQMIDGFVVGGISRMNVQWSEENRRNSLDRNHRLSFFFSYDAEEKNSSLFSPSSTQGKVNDHRNPLSAFNRSERSKSTIRFSSSSSHRAMAEKDRQCSLISKMIFFFCTADVWLFRMESVSWSRTLLVPLTSIDEREGREDNGRSSRFIEFLPRCDVTGLSILARSGWEWAIALSMARDFFSWIILFVHLDGAFRSLSLSLSLSLSSRETFESERNADLSWTVTLLLNDLGVLLRNGPVSCFCPP